jgi:hypothetical protein
MNKTSKVFSKLAKLQKKYKQWIIDEESYCRPVCPKSINNLKRK